MSFAVDPSLILMANYVLEILDGDRAGDVVPLAGGALRIGRKPGNDLVLADEKTSGVHAEIVLEGDRHVLRDLGSTNGTFLDGKRVTELVLTAGDIVTIGRLRVKFRAEGQDAGGDAGSTDLAVRRLDTARAGARSGSLGLVAALAAVGLAGGGWFYWQGRSGGGEAGSGIAKKVEVRVVGNKLADAIAGCESEDGFVLGAAGSSFASTGNAHSGNGAFEARRAEGGGGPDFAVLRTKDPVTVVMGHALTLAAHVRTSGGGQVALRAVAAAANEQSPFVFRTGTAMTASDGWQRIETVVALPSGCDRVQLELAAVLPTAESAVLVDDLAIVEGGASAAVEVKLADAAQPQTAIGTGAALAIRTVDADNPAVVLAVLPGNVPAPLQGLHRAELCVLSDVGASIACTAGERGFALAAKGIETLQFVLPADAANGLLVSANGEEFKPTAAASQFEARALLVGERLSRAMLQMPAAVPCTGALGGGRYRLTVGGNTVEVAFGFRAERVQSAELLRQAKLSRDDGKPGEALDKLRQIATRLPMDSEVLAQAAAVRGELLAAQAQTVRALQEDFEQATFFTTRGGFERVALGVDELVRRYGQQNLADGEALTALREAAQQQVAAIDSQTREPHKQRLLRMSTAFREASLTGLADLVQRYIDQHLGK